MPKAETVIIIHMLLIFAHMRNARVTGSWIYQGSKMLLRPGNVWQSQVPCKEFHRGHCMDASRVAQWVKRGLTHKQSNFNPQIYLKVEGEN